MISTKKAVELWIKAAGFCPMVAKVENWSPVKGFPGYCAARDARWVVVVEFAGFGDDREFKGEYDSREDAERAARAVNGWLTRWCSKFGHAYKMGTAA